MRIWIQILASKKGSKPLKNAKIGSYSIHFGLTSANWCGSGSVPDTAYKFWCGNGFLFDADAYPDADPGYQNYADPSGCGSRLSKLCGSLRIRIRIRIRIQNTGFDITVIHDILCRSDAAQWSHDRNHRDCCGVLRAGDQPRLGLHHLPHQVGNRVLETYGN